jgi:outer membrane protein assembly factor BamB
MPLSAEQYLNRLEQQGLLEASVIARLRRQVADAKKPILPETISKLLVDKGQLTAFQAKKLLEEPAGASSPPPAARRAAKEDEPLDLPSQGDEEDLGLATTDDDDLGLADDDDEPAKKPAAPTAADKGRQKGKAAPIAEDDEEIVELEEVAALSPIADAGGLTPLTPISDPPRTQSASAGLTPLDDMMSGGGMSGDPMMDGSLTDMGGQMMAPAPSQYPAGRAPGGFAKKFSGARWDSPLMLLGGGGLVLLLLLFFGLWFVLSRGSSEELFKLAEDAYREQSYSTAIERYDKFLSKYPKDDNASLARVRRGTARLRLLVEAKDWKRSLDSFREVLPEIESEAKFSEARPELASLLPAVAEGFSQQAKDASTTDQAKQLVTLAEQSMELVNNPSYIPSTLRKSQEARIEGILENIALAHRAINQEADLIVAVGEIKTATEQSRTAEAYAIRNTLLKKYPALESNESLVEAVLAVTEKERQLVKVVDQTVTPQTADDPPLAEFRVVLAGRSGSAVAGVEGRVVLALSGGAVYALDAATGSVLWRRYVGYETTTPPLPLTKTGDGDALLVDARRNELLRVHAADGQIVWRLTLGERFAEPVISGDHVFVTLYSGGVIDIDVHTGESARRAELPQPLAIGPSVDVQRPQLYQVGEHSNLYVLSAADLQCREVFYLGHKAGSIVVPPVMTLGHLFVAENAGTEYSLLHVIATDANGLKLRVPKDQPAIRLAGRVIVPPVLYGRRVLVVTDLGAIHIYEIDAANKDKPATEITKFTALTSEPLLAYPLAEEGLLFIADNRLTKYEIQTSLGKIDRKWINFRGDTFLAPPQLFGEAVVLVRRRENSPGTTVTAAHNSDGRTLWQTEIGAPLAGPPMVDQARRLIVAVSAQGQLFEITAEVLKAGYTDKPAAAVAASEIGATFSRSIDLGNGRLAFTNPSDRERILLYEPGQGTSQLKLVKMNSSARASLGLAVSFHGGLLVPTEAGQVLLTDAKTGGDLVLPFQPPLAAGETVRWQRPAVVGTDNKQFAVADHLPKLYLVGVKDQPQPHLTQLAETGLEEAIVSPLAAVGDTVYGVVRTIAGDTLRAFQLPSLSSGGEPVRLNGRLAWGPERLGDAVFLATDANKLFCFEAGQKLRWETPLPYGPLAGAPLADNGSYILASQRGVVWRVAADSGTESAKTDVGQPLGGPPVRFGTRLLLLSGSDGTLHVIPMLP